MRECKKCGNKMLLATGIVNDFEIDDEPYEDGIRELPETRQENKTIEDYVCVGIYYCERCEEIGTAWIEFPRKEKDDMDINSTATEDGKATEDREE